MEEYTFLDFDEFASAWLSADEFELVRDLEIQLCVSHKTNTIHHAVYSQNRLSPRGILAQRRVVDKVIHRLSKNLSESGAVAHESKNLLALRD
jgi:hypothetical protein